MHGTAEMSAADQLTSFSSSPVNVRSGRKLPFAAVKAALPQSPISARLLLRGYQDRMSSRAISLPKIMIAAAAMGSVFGLGTVAATPSGRSALAKQVDNVAVSLGWKRKREPEAGDQWSGCNDARASGTSPIYRGEPGYREDMDGDGDGIACEPQP